MSPWERHPELSPSIHCITITCSGPMNSLTLGSDSSGKVLDLPRKCCLFTKKMHDSILSVYQVVKCT